MACAPLFTPPGNPFIVVITGPEGAEATIQVTNDGGDAIIAGSVTSSPRAIVDGRVIFNITTAADATSSTVATGFVDGVEVGTCRIGLIEVQSGPTPSPSESTPEPSESGSTPEPSEITVVENAPPTDTTTGAVLSGTGFDGVPMAAGAALLLVAGAAVVVVAARRTTSRQSE
ncbi:hypothetical protein [Demequina iriomotensis]|uniref:hypothetical protein n=1 Tax=Demequina iriomotensis TaxID=1536641 RepID=UPI00078045D1|nr:hypothetical protein [Demequina iriomotensis]